MSTNRHSNGSLENPNGFSARPNLSPSQNKNNGVEAKRNMRSRGRDQLPPPAAKKTKPSAGSGKKSQNNLDELVAQTYAKGISILHQNHSDDTARGSKSRTKKKKAGKTSVQMNTPQTWKAKDEITFVNLLLACVGEGGQVDMATFYKQVKEALGINISRNTKLYDKMRSMRSRYWSIHSKINEGDIPEDKFTFRSQHEAALFKVWKQIWGNDVENHHEDEDAHNTGQPLSQNNGNFVREEDHRPEKNTVPVVENVMEGVQSKVETLIDSLIRRINGATNIQPFSPGFRGEIGTGSCLCSNLSGRMKELINAVRSVKEFPGLDEAEARVLQQKWRNHRVEELRIFCRSLELLQEECTLCLQELEK